MTNATKRNGIWHFRMNVPVDLQNHYGKATHSASLGTQDDLEAKKLADTKTRFFKAQHKQLRMDAKKGLATPIPASSPSPTQLVAVVDTSIIDRHMKFIDHVDKLSNTKIKLAFNRCGVVYQQIQHTLQIDDGLSVESLSGISLRTVLENGSNLYELCEQVSGKQDLSSNEHLRNMTARATIGFLVDYIIKLSDQLSFLLGVPNTIQAPNLSQPVTAPLNSPPHQQSTILTPVPNAKPAPLLSTVLEGCLGEKKRGAVTVDSLRSSVELLIEWFEDDKPISFYTRERMKSFVDDCLLHLPPNRKKVEKWKDFKLKEIVTKTKPQDLIAPDTMHNILSDLTTVFTYAVDDYDEFISKHPTLKLSAKLPEKDDDIDRSFPDEELKIILNNLEYDPEWPSRYWVVMLGFFTGARLNELCQLHLNDIKKADDFYYISINVDDADETFKRVKNKPSRRTVPIHPKMIEIGFMNYVKQRTKDSKGENKQLFPELVYKEKSGYGRQVGDWLRRYRKKLKIMNPVNRGFHGFRHTFIMWAQNKAEMTDREILELTGHENKAISKDHRRYSHALTAKRLNTQLVKLDYGLPMPSNPYMQPTPKES